MLFVAIDEIEIYSDFKNLGDDPGKNEAIRLIHGLPDRTSMCSIVAVALKTKE